MKKIALAISGLDPSGGAGLLLDARVFADHDVYATGVVSVLTEQSPSGLMSTLPVAPDFLERQLRRLLSEVPVLAIKIGALGSVEVAQAVAAVLGTTPVPVVLDPVLNASSGAPLIEDVSGVDLLLPFATLVTPNIPEAQALTGVTIEDSASMIDAAMMLLERGPQAVLIKGGHLLGDPVDLYYDGEQTVETSSPRIPGDPVRGTGCALSSAIAAWLCHGHKPLAATGLAQAYVREKIRMARPVGAGKRIMP